MSKLYTQSSPKKKKIIHKKKHTHTHTRTHKYVYKYEKVNLEKADLFPSRSEQKVRFPTAESPP